MAARARMNAPVIERQQAVLRAMLAKHVAPGARYALLDFPNYSNVGDSAIWLGQVKLLSALTGRGPAYVSTNRNFDPAALARYCPTGPVFICGGGNLGDLWPAHAVLREQLLTQLRDRAIVQLPQSIHYGDVTQADRLAALIRAHGAFTLTVRDTASQRFAAERLGCDAELVPDSAFGLGALRRDTPAHDVMLLLRSDHEAAGYDPAAFASLPDRSVADWLDEPRALKTRARRQALVKALLTGAWSKTAARTILYDRLADLRVRRGLAMLASGRRVVTDRLHAHILSTLLDIPHVALDNSYGKVSGYIAAWTADYPGVVTATSPEEAVAALERLP